MTIIIKIAVADMYAVNLDRSKDILVYVWH